MKGISAKRIFAIIGIVLGSVTAFAGAVIGVMAATGKFKTPIVFPTELVFVENDFVTIETVPFDTKKTWEQQFEGVDKELRPEIKFFTLEGNNSGSEYEVNKNNCYIWFDGNKGANLITLCDKDGKPLAKDENNRYMVKCNEPIYYMINKLEPGVETDGEVKLMARSENNKTQVDTPLTFWIDRSVQSVRVDTSLEYTFIQNPNEQTINIGVGIGFEFKYLVQTPQAFKPINHLDEKEIELYYVATGHSNDYIRVTQQEVENPESPLHSILTYSDDVLKFSDSVSAGKYTFKIAIFPTYQAEKDYLAMIEGVEIANPNYDRTENMLITTLTVNVQEIDINKVGMLGGNVVLNLYSKDDYVTLFGESGQAGAKDNNLELFMQKGEGVNTVLDYSRFDEVEFNPNFEELWNDKQPKFEADGVEEVWTLESLDGVEIVTANVEIGENLKLIDYIYKEGDPQEVRYYCINGVAVLDETGVEQKVRLLKAGSYLNFYYQTAIDEFVKADFDYSIAKVVNAGKTKSWNIIAKEIPDLTNGTIATDDDLDLTIGILVVNNNGKFEIENFFDSVSVVVNEVVLDYEVQKEEDTMSITYTDHGTKRYAEQQFSYYINLKNKDTASYNACVLITPITDDIGNDINPIVHTINGIVVEVNGSNQKYAIVGYIDPDTGEFINSVKLNGNVSKDQTTCQMFMMQFMNEFNVTADDIIKNYLSGITTEIPSGRIYSGDEITISANYIINSDILSYNFFDVYTTKTSVDNIETNFVGGKYTVYENTEDHKVVIRIKAGMTSSMLEDIYTFYGVNSTFFNINFDENLEITNVEMDADKTEIIATYKAIKCLSDTTLPINIVLEGCGEDCELPSLRILSASPKQIVLKADGDSINLTTKTVAEDPYTTNYLEVIVGWDGTKYSYTFKAYKNGEIVGNDDGYNKSLFNYQISASGNGFQDAEDKGQILSVTYDSTNKSIFDPSKLATGNLVEREGETVLVVTIGTTTQYLKVVVEADGFTLGTVDNKTAFESSSNTFSLSQAIEFKYSEDSITNLNNSRLVFVDNLKFVSYGNGNLTVHGDRNTGWTLKKGETDILSYDEETGVFTKHENFYSLSIQFDVTTIIGTKTISLSFIPSVSADLNNAWSEMEFYAGTTINILGTDDFSVFKVNDSQFADFSYKVKTSSGEESYANDVKYKADESDIGKNVEITILYNGVQFGDTREFKVLPNAVATLKTDTVLSNTENVAFGAIYEVKAYATGDSNVYGSSVTKMYSNDDMLTGSPSGLKLGIDSDSELTIEDNDGSLTIGHIKNLNKESLDRIIKLYDANDNLISSDTITITNRISVTPTATGEFDEEENRTWTYEPLRVYNSFVTATGLSLTDISADDVEFSVGNGTFTLNTIITEPIDVEVTLIFNEVFTYTTQINLRPYMPKMKADYKLYSGTETEIINALFNTTGEGENQLLADTKIKQLIIKSIEDFEGNEITEKGSFTPGGYIMGETPDYKVKFKEIYGPNKAIKITFEITYNDDNNTTCEYTVDLVLTNRQKIDIKYPESDLKLDGVTYKFIEDYIPDALEISGAQQADAENLYEISAGKPYEPILVYSNESTILNFAYDTHKKFSRATILNMLLDGSVANEALAISLIAYENNPGMVDFIAGINENYDTNQISLPQAPKGIFGSLIFKLVSGSGYYEYYYVYICCLGDSNTISTENNLEVVAYYNGADLYSAYTGDNVVHVDVTAGPTYAALVSGIEANVFESVFKTEYDVNKTSLYLYHGTYTGETEDDVFDYGDNARWSKLDNNATIKLDVHFNTITLGLVYSSGTDVYCYGTITIYVQPTNAVTQSGLTIGLPNGEFTKNIGASADTIDCPFNTSGWSAEIKSVTNEAGQVVDSHGFTFATDIVNLHGRRVSEITYIRVKYERNDGTIAFVTYAYQATELPEDNQTVKVDSFDNGFNNTVTLTTTTGDPAVTTYIEEYFKTYQGGYSLKVDETNLENGESVGNVAFANGVLTFTQTTEEQIFDITITYTNFIGDDKDRTFRFIVKKGVYLDDSSTDNDSGLTATKRAPTTKYTYAYTSKIGSTLGITKTPISTSSPVRTYCTYEIGDLEINTSADSVLRLRFDENAYVLNGENILGANEYLEFTGTGAINFVHSAIEKPITITIEVVRYLQATVEIGTSVVGLYYLDGSKYILIEEGVAEEGKTYYTLHEYTTRNLYVKVCQTYTTLQANYLGTGAQYENVKGGTSDYSANDILSSIKLTVGTNNYIYDSTLNDGNKKAFKVATGNSAVYYYDIQNKELFDAGKQKITGGTWFSETYTVDGIDYSFTYCANSIKLTVGNNEYIYDSTLDLGGKKAFKLQSGTEAVYFYDTQAKKLYDSDAIEITGGTWANETYNASGTTYKFLYTMELFDGSRYIPCTLSDLGFTQQGNPNCINFTVNEGAVIRNDGNIVFNTVTENTMCSVYLNNSAGLTTNSVVYNFQIMALETGVDGLDYSSSDGHDGTKEINKYISFMLKDTDASVAYSNAVHNVKDKDTPFVIGSLKDLKNNGYFNVAITSPTGITPTKVVISDGSASSSFVGDYVNAVQYKFTKDNYDFYVTLDTDSKQVELIVERGAGEYIKNFNLQLSFGGANGGSTIVENLTIVLRSVNVNSPYEDSSDESIYAGYTIDLIKNVNNDGKIIEKQGVSSPITLTYNLIESTYRVGGGQTIPFTTTNNAVFNYDSTAKKIETKQVGDDTTVVANFAIKDGNYILGTVTYRFIINLNLQIVTNAETLKNNIGNSAPETKFVITDSVPTQVNFINKAQFASDHEQDDYYKVLVYDLYYIKDQNNPNATDEDLLGPTSEVKVSLHSNTDSRFELVANGIKFKQDFEGYIELKLTVETDSGEYYVIWTIYVSAIYNIRANSTNPDMARFNNNGIAFNSGTSWNIISPSSATGVGILMNTAPKFISNVSATAYYGYKINKVDATTQVMSNEQLYGSSGSVVDETLSGNRLQITLPQVPTTTKNEQQAYYVTYKIYVTYSELDATTAQVFYITYEVVNYQSVDVHSANVNMSRVQEVEGAHYLDLFYYDETYTTDTTTYKFTYTENNGTLNVTLTVGTDNYYIYDSSQDIGAKKAFKQTGGSTAVYYYDTQAEGLFQSTDKITGGTWTNNTYNPGSSVFKFSSTANNIFAFKEFIDLYVGEKSVKIEGLGEFTLVEIADGRYGIDLAENLDLSDPDNNILFSNEKSAKLSLYSGGVETIVVNAYSPANTSGFRLYASNSITAETKALSTMIPTEYFTDDNTSDDFTINSQIIGVGKNTDTDLGKGWVNYADLTPSSGGTELGTIKIPSGPSTYNEYKIYKLTYSIITSGLIYEIEQTFYYIEGDYLVVPDYRTASLGSSYFKKSYDVDEQGKVVLDLTNGVKVWSMVSNKLTSSPANEYSNAVFTSQTGVTLPSLNTNKKSIVIDSAALINHKINNPTATNYPMIYAKLTVDISNTNDATKDLYCGIEFSLPKYDELQFVKEFDTSSTSDVSLDLSLLKSIVVEDDYSDYISFTAGNGSTTSSTAIIDDEKLNGYFTTNSNKKELIINVVGTKTDDSTVEFTIKINKKEEQT